MKKSCSLSAGIANAILVSVLLFFPNLSHAASTVTFTAENEIAQQNASLGVPVDVSGFTTVSSFQFTLQWDPGVLTFESEGNFANIGGFNSGNFGISSVSSGKLTVSWDDPNFATDGGGVSLSDGSPLFLVNFAAVGNTGLHSSLDFVDVPTAREVTVLGNLATFLSVSGGVDITPVPEPSAAGFSLFFAALAGARFLARRHRA
jgi:hypothetical protein